MRRLRRLSVVQSRCIERWFGRRLCWDGVKTEQVVVEQVEDARGQGWRLIVVFRTRRHERTAKVAHFKATSPRGPTAFG